jgi:hypothetical protein
MDVSPLLDEMTEAMFSEYCRNPGHDTERVVTVASLGPGSDDADIVDTRSARTDYWSRTTVTF